MGAESGTSAGCTNSTGGWGNCAWNISVLYTLLMSQSAFHQEKPWFVVWCWQFPKSSLLVFKQLWILAQLFHHSLVWTNRLSLKPWDFCDRFNILRYPTWSTLIPRGSLRVNHFWTEAVTIFQAAGESSPEGKKVQMFMFDISYIKTSVTKTSTSQNIMGPCRLMDYSRPLKVSYEHGMFSCGPMKFYCGFHSPTVNVMFNFIIFLILRGS